MLGVMALFLLNILAAWAWAQSQSREVSLAEILSTAGIEWGSMLVFGVCHLFPPSRTLEAPPLFFIESPRRQSPIVFIPSLHTGRGLFKILIWRLKKHHFSSLWPFTWKSFLTSSVLLEDQIRDFLNMVIQRTQSSQITIISFGTSRPVISRVLNDPILRASCQTWIAISAPEQISSTLRFISTPRLRSVFQNNGDGPQPDLVITGSHDTFCYPDSVFGNVRRVTIEPVGHYGSLFHSEVVQNIMRELN